MNRNGGRRESLAAYAGLIRLPNLFTAPPDVVLGAALIAGTGGTVAVDAVAGLAVASMLLYAAGTTLNGYFDFDEDSRDRPERPLPSGAVPRGRALALGVGLLVGGVLAAWVTAGPAGGAVAGALALVVLLYDAVFNGSPVGTLFMGGSRGLNVLLGTTAATVVDVPPTWVLAVAATVFAYIAGVTYMAEGETGGGDRRTVLVGVGSVAIAGFGVVALLVVRSPSLLETAVAAFLLVGFGLWTGRSLRTAYVDPEPGTIGPAVGACVLGLVVLDAAFAATVDPRWAVAILPFLVPAVGLSRLFDVS